MWMPDTGNDKPRKPVRPTLDISRRQLTISLQITKTQTTTPATQIMRNSMGNPTKANNSLENKPPDLLPKLTCLAN
jgi:hypothetical protein